MSEWDMIEALETGTAFTKKLHTLALAAIEFVNLTYKGSGDETDESLIKLRAAVTEVQLFAIAERKKTL